MDYISSIVEHLTKLGYAEGRERGLRDGQCQMLGLHLLTFGRHVLGELMSSQRAHVQALDLGGDLATLERLASEITDCRDWDTLLADVPAPANRIPDPTYVVPWEDDYETIGPALDAHMEVTSPTGPQIIHMRFQRVYQPNIDELLAKDHATVTTKYPYPITTVLILTRRESDGPAMNSSYTCPRGGKTSVRRLWEEPVEALLASIGLAPYAGQANITAAELPGVIRRIEALIHAQTHKPDEIDTFRLLTYINAGMQFSVEEVHAALGDLLPLYEHLPNEYKCRSQGYHQGRDDAHAEGILMGARTWIRKFGAGRLGVLPAEYDERLANTTDRNRLSEYSFRILLTNKWEKVFAIDKQK